MSCKTNCKIPEATFYNTFRTLTHIQESQCHAGTDFYSEGMLPPALKDSDSWLGNCHARLYMTVLAYLGIFHENPPSLPRTSHALCSNNFPHHSTLDCTVYKHTCNRNRISTNTYCKANKKSKCQPTITISNTYYSLYRYIEKYQPQTARIRHVYTIVIEPTILIQPHRETVP